MKSAQKEYDIESEKTVNELLGVTQTYMDLFDKLNALITELDCFLALAHVAANAPTQYVRPTMLPLGSNVLKMTEARHPCIEQLGVNFIPNSLDMVKGESNVQIITGVSAHHSSSALCRCYCECFAHSTSSCFSVSWCSRTWEANRLSFVRLV